jgi:cholesterol transport system auxiliary component
VRVVPDPSWPTVAWQLSVTKPTAARVVDSARISVRPVPGELQVYKGVTWLQPSTDLIEATVLRALEDSGRIPAVARSGSGIRADYKLVMDLRRFESDYAGASVPSATIELTAKLLHASDQRIVASRTFLQVEPATGIEVAQVAGAFNQALEKLGGEVAGWVLTTGESDARQKH